MTVPGTVTTSEPDLKDSRAVPLFGRLCSAAATTERTGLIAPHGGKLVNLMLPEGAPGQPC
jgi:hypothetical protein